MTSLIVVVQSLLMHEAAGTLVVNPPLPITHRVDIQIIRTSLDSGLSPAPLFGNATQRAAVEAEIDKVWAQAGIDVRFLPTITPYASTLALLGATLPRPTSDLDEILSRADAAGKLHSDPQVLNMFFVGICPGQFLLDDLSIAGLGSVGNNGIAMFVGARMPSAGQGTDKIARVLAHEIGHNLGLGHTTPASANLMSQGGTTGRLTAQQIQVALKSNFLKSVGASGDFNNDGHVNGADLIIWRNAYGVNGNGDADGDNDTDGRDFLVWQKQYGNAAFAPTLAVPEPPAGCLATLAVVGAILSRRR